MTERPDRDTPLFQTVPVGWERPPDRPTDELQELFGKMSPEVRRSLQAVQGHEVAFREWFAADPTRIIELRRDAKTTIAAMLTHVGLDARDVGAVVAPRGWTLEPMQLRPVATAGASLLLAAVWQHVNTAAANLTAFQQDPRAVVTAVATATSAEAADRDTVIQAFTTVLGLPTTLSFDPFTTQHLARLKHGVPSGSSVAFLTRS